VENFMLESQRQLAEHHTVEEVRKYKHE
jgi:hypothetical protein